MIILILDNEDMIMGYIKLSHNNSEYFVKMQKIETKSKINITPFRPILGDNVLKFSSQMLCDKFRTSLNKEGLTSLMG